ncbi:MAG: hypothetical protein R3B13_22720 [Polyangiaceae bacterium]
MSLRGCAGVLCVALFGCQEQPERAQNLGNCPADNPNCAGLPPVGGGGGSGSKDGGIADGQAGQVGALTGTVIGVASDDFTTGAAFVETATIQADAPGTPTVSTKYDGSSYTFDVPIAPTVWLGVVPEVGSAFLPTLQAVDTASFASANLLVLRASVIEEIYALLTVPETILPDRAHVVVRFLDAAKLTPLPGVSASHQGEVVSYDAGGTWSDTTGETGAAGYAVIVNAKAQSFTAKQKVSFVFPGVQGSVELAMRAGAVTLADVAITK